ncbi:MAG: baseplate J/gp47 family protein, partial [Bacteroidaceae bacterium]
MGYDIIVPKGTRITVDGDITFETKEQLKVKAGELYGDVEGVCQQKGTIGDGFTPGQVAQLVDLYDYYDKVENITTSSGGAEEEGDDAFYQRMRESTESFSTAGPEGAYKYHAKTASPLVADVEVDSTEAGVIDVCVLLQDGEMPTEEVLKHVEEALSSKKVRPLTDSVRVSAPKTVDFDVELTYYIPKESQNSTNIIKEDVEKAIDQYIAWQTEKMGRDINPSRLISLAMSKGAKRVDVIKPMFQAINTT